jgi:hypothetical protein
MIGTQHGSQWTAAKLLFSNDHTLCSIGYARGITRSAHAKPCFAHAGVVHSAPHTGWHNLSHWKTCPQDRWQRRNVGWMYRYGDLDDLKIKWQATKGADITDFVGSIRFFMRRFFARCRRAFRVGSRPGCTREER